MLPERRWWRPWTWRGGAEGDAHLEDDADRADRGMVTAETAVVLPALVLVLGGCLWALTVVKAELQCIDAARAAVRVAARGDGDARARAAALEAAPRGSTVLLTRRGGFVRAEVRATAGSPALGIGTMQVGASAGALDEAALQGGALTTDVGAGLPSGGRPP